MKSILMQVTRVKAVNTSRQTKIHIKNKQQKKHPSLDSTDDGEDNINDSDDSQLKKEGRQTVF